MGILRSFGLGVALLFLSAGVCAAEQWRPLFWSEDISVAVDHASIVIPADYTGTTTMAKVTYALRKPHMAEGKYLTSYVVTTERWTCGAGKRTIDMVQFYDGGGRLLGSVANKEPPVRVNNGSFAPYVFEAVCAYELRNGTVWASAFDHWKSMSARMNADGQLTPIAPTRWAFLLPISQAVSSGLVIDLGSIRSVGGLTIYRMGSLTKHPSPGESTYFVNVYLIDCRTRLGRPVASLSYGRGGVTAIRYTHSVKMTSDTGFAPPVVCDGRMPDGPYFGSLVGAYSHYENSIEELLASDRLGGSPPPAAPSNPAEKFDYLCSVQFSGDDGASWGPVLKFRYNIDLSRTEYNAAATPQANPKRARRLYSVTPSTLHLQDSLSVNRRTGDLFATYGGGKPLMKGRCQKGPYTPF